jgi:carbon monoxide dehydrogenase subunit G
MELTGERIIPAPRQRTWEALNDPDMLKACITGCESLERDGEGGMVALVAVRVGPVSARFKGKLKLSDVVAPVSYTIHFDGQGGVAGFGKGSADVSLSDAGAGRTHAEVRGACAGGWQAGTDRLTPGGFCRRQDRRRLLPGLRNPPA